MPDLDLVLREANKLLILNALPACKSVEPVADLDTANVNLIGHAEGRDYAIKVRVRELGTLERQQCVANALRKRTGLPIPEHLCHSDPDNGIIADGSVARTAARIGGLSHYSFRGWTELGESNLSGVLAHADGYVRGRLDRACF